jgi:hypothetical protein
VTFYAGIDVLRLILGGEVVAIAAQGAESKLSCQILKGMTVIVPPARPTAIHGSARESFSARIFLFNKLICNAGE